MAEEERKEEEEEGEEEKEDPKWYITKDMSEENVDYKGIIENIWQFIVDFTPEMRTADQTITPTWDEEIILAICKQALGHVEENSFTMEIEVEKGEVTVFGPIYGQGDSFISLISAVGLPPTRQYLFLGNFTGLGYASFECLMMALCFKCLFPNNVHILRGTNEDREMSFCLKTVSGMLLRGISSQGFMGDIIYVLDNFFANLPLIVKLPNKIWAMSGGIGPHLNQRGIEKWFEVKKEEACERTLSEGMVIQEILWGCLNPGNTGAIHFDGVPSYNEEEINKFCMDNDIQLILRGRQVAADGVLHYPECLVTVSSSCALIDLFENDGACLTIIGNRAVVHSVKMNDPEVHTLDYAKMGVGRNAMR